MTSRACSKYGTHVHQICGNARGKPFLGQAIAKQKLLVYDGKGLGALVYQGFLTDCLARNKLTKYEVLCLH